MAEEPQSPQHIPEAELTRRLLTVVNNASDFISTSDLEGNVLYINPKGLEMIGRPGIDPTNKSIDYHPPKSLKIIDEQCMPAVMEKGIWTGELEMQHADGHIIPVSGAITLIKDDSGEPVGFGALYRDITEQEKAEDEREQLLSEKSRLKAIIDSTSDLVAMTDLEGNLLYLNTAGFEMTGRDVQDPATLNIADFHPPEAVKQTLEEHVPTCMQHGAHTWENILLRADGSTIPVSQVSMAIKDESGEPVALGTIMRDLTEQRHAEAEREQLQQEIIEAQQQTLRELSSPIIPVMDGIIIMPLIGNIDTSRAREITRSLLSGISAYRAKSVIIDITGVPVVDSGVADHLNKTIQAARLKGAQTILTGMSDAVAETIVDLGIDWSALETLRDLQTGLTTAIKRLKTSLNDKKNGNGKSEK
jgi:rsbT co-antagonist protein RsbR